MATMTQGLVRLCFISLHSILHMKHENITKTSLKA